MANLNSFVYKRAEHHHLWIKQQKNNINAEPDGQASPEMAKKPCLKYDNSSLNMYHLLFQNKLRNRLNNEVKNKNKNILPFG